MCWRQGIRIAVTDGAAHAVDSSELAFKLACLYAFRDAYNKAKPVILEPIMNVEVSPPPPPLSIVPLPLHASGCRGQSACCVKAASHANACCGVECCSQRPASMHCSSILDCSEPAIRPRTSVHTGLGVLGKARLEMIYMLKHLVGNCLLA